MGYCSKINSFLWKNPLLYLSMGFLFLGSCAPKEPSKKTIIQRDLPEIRSDSVLNIITTYSPTSYFLYKGEPMGYEYEMAKHLADHLGLKLEVTVAKNFNEILQLLQAGKGDLAAFGLTITRERRKHIAFTDFLYLTHQVLVQRMPDNWRQMPAYKVENEMVRDLYELIGDTITIAQGTTYAERLKHLSEEVGGKIHVREIDDEVTLDAIIGMVSRGEIKYTVVDYNLATVDKSFYDNIDIDTRVSLNQRIAWGVRKDSPQLLDTVNDWLRHFKKDQLYHVLYNKYYRNVRSYKPRIASEFFTLYSGKISPFDTLLKQAAKKNLGWDWRLLAAQVYQESQFNAHSRGRLGSVGLLQLMPDTAKDLGISNSFDPQQNLEGGSRYIKDLYEKFTKIPDSIQRIKFALAAFNSGLGHVRDAQRLAESLDKNPLVWDKNTEEAMLKLGEKKYYSRPEVRYGFVRGRIPYNYVQEIFDRFEHYQKLVLWESEENTGNLKIKEK